MYLPSSDLKTFTVRLHEATFKKQMYFFWYGLFNEAVTKYYLAQENLSPLLEVKERTPFDQSVWFATFNPKDLVSETWFSDWLKYTLAKADFIVIPEKADAFAKMWSSPMVAARRFGEEDLRPAAAGARRLTVSLHGSLAYTGKGHGTDRAIVLALAGETPDAVDPDRVPTILANMAEAKALAKVADND